MAATDKPIETALEQSIPIESAPEEPTPEESAPGESSPSEPAGESETPSSEPGDVSGGDGPGVEVSSGDAPVVDISVGDVSGGDYPPGNTLPDQIVKEVILDNPDVLNLLCSIYETEQLKLESSLKIEAQNEAVISILLIILVVGMLHYIYRFFKLFF